MTRFIMKVVLVSLLAIVTDARADERLKEIRFQVGKDYPTWVLRYHTEEGEPYTEYSTILDSVEIVEARSGELVQKLELPGGGLPVSDLDDSTFQDVNFDGYKDIAIHSGSYAGGNCSVASWMFDGIVGKFKYNEELSGLTNVQIDRDRKRVLSSSSCCAGLSRTAETYKWIGPHLVLVEEITAREMEPQPEDLKAPDDCPNPTWVIEVTERRVNGKLQKVGSKRYPMCG